MLIPDCCDRVTQHLNIESPKESHSSAGQVVTMAGTVCQSGRQQFLAGGGQRPKHETYVEYSGKCHPQ